MRLKKISKFSNICVVATVILVSILMIRAIAIQKTIHSLDVKIANSKKELALTNTKLKALETELKQVDSLEYIEKIATDRLGLVKYDAIIIREKVKE